MDDIDALEKPSEPTAPTVTETAQPKQSFGKRIVGLSSSVNPYLMLFIAVFIIAIIIVITMSISSRNEDPANILFDGTEISQETLDELLTSESTVGTVDQTLTVAANSIFNGKVLIKDSLDVAGAINVGGALSLPGITVSGESNFDDVNVSNNLSILGSASIQQNLTVQQSLDVTGNVAIAGTLSASSISADTIQFSSNAVFTRHIDTGGGQPSISTGTAVGSGGTVSLSGNDIAGTVTINTGGSPPAGIFANINFVSAYNSTPNIQITPIGSSSASLFYYATRDVNGFKIGTINTPAGSTTYVFDYFVTE
jgi:cytoskeletal protein CcmA (bactofilin family)